jgi:hypothetical protein
MEDEREGQRVVQDDAATVVLEHRSREESTESVDSIVEGPAS